VVVMEAATGKRLGLMDGGVVTARRTAALSLLAAREPFSWDNAVPLEDVLRAPERPEGTVVFKSVGHALWDLAAAHTAFGD